MAQYSQANRPLRLDSPLGKDVLLPVAFTGSEGVSTPFAFQVDLISEDPAVAAEKLLRNPVVLTIALPDGAERKFHGLVSRFSQLGQEEDLTFYQAEIVPWLWFLSLSRDCRIFQNLTAPEIVEEVFKSQGFSDFKIQCTRSYAKREFCVQYRETHLNFVSRLLEEEGIIYYFEHTDSAHTLVVTDSNGSVRACPGLGGGVRMKSQPAPGEEVVLSLRQEHAVHAGMVTLKDYDYLQPTLSLESSVAGDGRAEIYDYPGEYTTRDAGDFRARVRLEAEEVRGRLVHGESNCRFLASGHKFSLVDHYRQDANGEYILTSVRHRATAGDYRSWEAAPFDYRSEFQAIPSKVPCRPPRQAARPVVRGSQTAIVVGKSGEEIWTDEYGRVKVQFYWDREGKRDENSSCWLRVASTWAGKGWGMIQIPRIGQEVIVDFLEGDPDRPIITGRVYNADQVPPYSLPANQTQSGIKSRSSKSGSTETFNEIRLEDLKDKEQIYVHAERDLDAVVENSETRQIGLVKKDPGDQTVTIHNNQTVTLNEGTQTTAILKGDQVVRVEEGDRTIEVAKGKEVTTLGEGDQLLTIKRGKQAVDIKQGDHVTTLGQGKQTVDIKMGDQTIKLGQGSQTVEIKMGDQTIKLGMGNLTTKASLGKIAQEAMQSIELKVGQNSIKIDQTGVTIKGMMVKVEGQVQTQVKGLMTQIDGTAMLQAKGGITMIN